MQFPNGAHFQRIDTTDKKEKHTMKTAQDIMPCTYKMLKGVADAQSEKEALHLFEEIGLESIYELLGIIDETVIPKPMQTKRFKEFTKKNKDFLKMLAILLQAANTEDDVREAFKRYREYALMVWKSFQDAEKMAGGRKS
jgi:hypothetical protein